MIKLLISTMLISFSVLAQTPQYPEEEWLTSTPEEQGFNTQKLDVAFQFAFSEKEPHRTDTLLVIRNGKLIKEQYSDGAQAETLHRIWSCTKSFVGALFGITINKRLLTLDTTIASYYPEIDKRVTVENMLMMSSGLDWNEGYEGNPLRSQVIRMLYTDGYKDMATFVSRRNQIYRPGTHFQYSSGETNLLMGFLRDVVGNEKYENYPWVELFDPLKIKNVTWQRDQKGTYIGSSYLFMRARDFAKLGYLYLHQGKWKETQLIEPDYIKKSIQPNPAFLNTKMEGEWNRHSYGMHWWLNVDLSEKNETRIYPDVPNDAYFALGHHGQTLAVIPSLNLIIVRYGSDKKQNIDRNKLVSLITQSVEKN